MIIEATPSLKGENAIEFLKEMKRKENSKLSKSDKMLIKEMKGMTDKILGFKEKEHIAQNKATYVVDKTKLVPVYLKSESVTIEWLKKECKRISGTTDVFAVSIAVNTLLTTAKKQAKAVRE